ncbi:MAG: energy-coupling factor transporter transmembrane protein EcfT [Coriobacteriales bacterium]|jgi:energy-coupling factor transport system permease protein|nr:energy-coupling factor transporter transmembrane protein EcfT [Coriobacteriales bacterium]
MRMPLGQYIAGDSILHRLDARMKLLLLAAYVAALFLIQTSLAMIIGVAILLACYFIARISLVMAFRGLLPVAFILAFTFCAHAFTLTYDPSVTTAEPLNLPPLIPDFFASVFLDGIPDFVPIWGSFAFKPVGALEGLFFVTRIFALISATTLLTITSSIVTLTSSISQLLRPLARIKVPVEDVAMMFSIALRFIPLISEQAEKLVFAMSARGQRFNQGGPIRRLRAYVPVLIPLFVSLFRRADTLALAMESRCYQGENRTRLANTQLTVCELISTLTIVVMLLLFGILC